MFKDLIPFFMREIEPLARGHLFCLAYTRVLVSFLEARSIPATPLVVRCVVFGRSNTEALGAVSVQRLAGTAINGDRANGTLDAVPAQERVDGTQPQIPFRTLGFTHDGTKQGSYDSNGKWSGHLVVVSGTTMIDPTIGQINAPHYRIDFNPPYLVSEVDEEFCSGRKPLIVESGGKWIYYQAFPDEDTYKKSTSWSDPKISQQYKKAGIDIAKKLDGDKPSTEYPKVGRNDPCPCGSTKKYKKCHGK